MASTWVQRITWFKRRYLTLSGSQRLKRKRKTQKETEKGTEKARQAKRKTKAIKNEGFRNKRVGER